METYHVYQFYDANGNIIYVGKTKNAVQDRMKQHFGPNGHLSQDILQQVKCIKYYEFLTERDMNLAEAYLIRKYKGLYNTKREHISKEDIKYIEDKISKQKIKHYWGTDIWQQCSKDQLKRKTTILKQMSLRLKNTSKDLI